MNHADALRVAIAQPRAARRPEVEWFADAMERKLRENDHKRHWRDMSLQYLSMRLTQERKELYSAIASGDAALVLDEAADVANFAMMVADVVRRTRGVAPAASPDWDNRRTDSLSGWINELRALADHPRSMDGWLRSAMRTIADGLSAHADAVPDSKEADRGNCC